MATGSRTKSRTSKAEQARLTRRRITAAATELFLRDGFLTTTMAAVAAEAGVAVQTLYLAFGNKTAILSAAFDVAVVGDDEPVPVMERTWLRAALDDPDGVAGLTAFVTGGAAVIERAAPLYGVIRAAAADPEVAQILAQNKKERYEGYARIIEAAAAKPGFTTQLTQAEATGVLYALLSEETYGLLVEEHDWPCLEWRDWVLRTVLAEVFPEGTPTGRT